MGLYSNSMDKIKPLKSILKLFSVAKLQGEGFNVFVFDYLR